MPNENLMKRFEDEIKKKNGELEKINKELESLFQSNGFVQINGRDEIVAEIVNLQQQANKLQKNIDDLKK